MNKSKSAKAIGFLVAVMMLGGSVTANAASLTESQISSILSLLSSFGAEQGVIDNVNASLRGTAPSGGSSTTGGSSAAVCPYTWTRSLTTGDTGDDVMALQKFLNATSVTQIASSGVGSPGNETSYFGSLTAAAVAKFQNTYSSEVLAPLGLNAGTGYFGASSRAKANALCSSAPTTTTPDTGTGTTVPAGTGLTVSNTVQPTNTLAPDSASRVPFTKFTVTAGSDGPVTINSVTVERQGLSSNNVFSGIVLVDQDGTQYGLAKSLNSNNRANVGSSVTVPAGTSRTFTIAGNMASDNSTRDGQSVSLALVGINTSATVSGSLPIVGATHTVNASLSIGTVTAERGALDPNAANTKEVGTTGYTFASIKLTAGSAEDVRLHSIRFNQSGSASASDLENVKIVIDGVEYPAQVNDDYYSTNFSGGIVIKEGLTKDILIKGDIVSGSDRTIVMDIYQDTDVYVTGETFGYGITPTATTASASSSSSQFTTGTPWYDNAHTTVGTGSVVVSSTNDVPAGNIAEGQSNVNLGSFKFDVKGEEVSFTQLVLTIATTSGSGTDGGEAITNVTLVDQNGSVIAGPQDPNSAGSSVTLSDTVTLSAGVHTIYVKGTLDNDWENNDTIAVSFNPATAISSLTGETSGQTLTASPSATVTGKTQTINAAALTVTPDSSLVAQNIINNSNGAVLARYVLDASASGEDLRITTVQIRGDVGANLDIDDINTVQLFDGSTALNTGSNVLNPSGNVDGTDANITLTLDSPGFTVPKGTTKVVELRGNVNDATIGSTPTIKYDFTAGSPDWTVTGLQTGTSVTETLSSTAGAVMTVVDSGTLTATLSSADPVEKWYVAGSEAPVGVIRLTGTNEPLALTDLSLLIDTASSSSSDVQSVSLWDGATKLVEKLSPFVSSNTEAFDLPSSGTGSFIVPKDTHKDLTVKVKFAQIGTSLAGASGNWVKIATSTTAADHKSLGAESGTSANILGSLGTSTGAKYFRSLPTLAKGTVSNTTLANGTQELYRWTVTADPAGDIAIYKFSFTVSTTTANADTYSIVELTSGKTVASSLNTVAGQLEGVVVSGTYGSDFITIPAGQTYTYQLKAVVTNAGDSGDSVVVYLNDDSAVISATTDMLTAANVDSDANDNFIWSPISDGSASLTDVDWNNGYKVPGIESDNLGSEVISN